MTNTLEVSIFGSKKLFSLNIFHRILIIYKNRMTNFKQKLQALYEIRKSNETKTFPKPQNTQTPSFQILLISF